MTRDRLPSTHDELLDALPMDGWMARDRRVTMRLMEARDVLAAAEDALAVAAAELGHAVRKAYDGGNSWHTIGTILGISRQAAQQRFGRRPDLLDDDAPDGPAADPRGADDA